MSEPSWSVVKADMRDLVPLTCQESVDAIVCDPPYGLSKTPDAVEVLKHWLAGDDYRSAGGGFMGKSWDGFVPGPSYWKVCYDALKPGGHLVAFGGTRTFDLLTMAIRLAGFEIRDTIAWMYGSGFPKSLDVSKAIDKAAGVEREVVSSYERGLAMHPGNEGVDNWRENYTGKVDVTVPATPEAQEWEGWGTALKPAHEPIIIARKPFKGNVAKNVLAHGAGVLNIDGCRIVGLPESPGSTPPSSVDGRRRSMAGSMDRVEYDATQGRWPANVVLDEEAADVLDEQTGESISRVGKPRGSAHGEGWGMTETGAEYNDRGGASRFFYCAKTAKKERNAGLPEGLENKHPTVKPIEVMRWLVRLVTPPGGVVLDPFAGSCSTGCAAVIEGFGFIGVELDEDGQSVEVGRHRIAHWAKVGAGSSTQEEMK